MLHYRFKAQLYYYQCHILNIIKYYKPPQLCSHFERMENLIQILAGRVELDVR